MHEQILYFCTIRLLHLLWEKQLTTIFVETNAALKRVQSIETEKTKSRLENEILLRKGKAV